jgi:hypothetical protein
MQGNLMPKNISQDPGWGKVHNPFFHLAKISHPVAGADGDKISPGPLVIPPLGPQALVAKAVVGGGGHRQIRLLVGQAKITKITTKNLVYDYCLSILSGGFSRSFKKSLPRRHSGPIPSHSGRLAQL